MHLLSISVGSYRWVGRKGWGWHLELHLLACKEEGKACLLMGRRTWGVQVNKKQPPKPENKMPTVEGLRGARPRGLGGPPRTWLGPLEDPESQSSRDNRSANFRWARSPGRDRKRGFLIESLFCDKNGLYLHSEKRGLSSHLLDPSLSFTSHSTRKIRILTLFDKNHSQAKNGDLDGRRG